LKPPAYAIRWPTIPASSPILIIKQQRAFLSFAQTRSSKSFAKSHIPSGSTAEIGRHEASRIKMDAYNFPEYRLKKKMDDPSKTPLLLVACGSFSPITFLHLRMFVMAADYVKFSTDFEIIGGYLSPVSEAYKKAGLASAEHR
jgi:Cytidylyltransferase-like